MKTLNLPIKWKLTLWYSLILAFILILFSSGVYIYFKNSLQKSIDTKLKSIADVLSTAIVETHSVSVFNNFERYLENVLGKKPKGKIIQIMDSSGRIGAKMSDIEAETLPTPFTAIERTLKGEVIYETIETHFKQRIRTILVPIMDKEKITSIVQVGTSLEDFDETMRRLLIIFLISIPTSIAITTISGYFLSRKALRPVDKIRRAAIKISSSNLDERIDIGEKRDELGRLATTFNDMIERLKDSFQRVNQFSIDVSHELKTPLTILKGETEVTLRKDRSIEDYKNLLKSNLEEIDRMTSIIDDLLLLSKADSKDISLKTEEISLKDLIIDVCLDMQIFAKNKGVKLILGNIDEVRLQGDELKLRRMLCNIIENGIKYTPEGGKVEVYSSSSNGYININIRDNGIGISESDIKFIFDRFYRGDKSRRRESGSGLGLSISKWIAEAHGGSIEATSSPSQGSLFTVRLPL
ncbi:MAG: heavy metal sensor histidine kinase [Syntrophorhabdaceae bacterium]|nr:heavy metal sensor histidine kinase [Syntrophorhabdales bacterium]MBP9561450.1 heavy metal sensor histidine kinase [Syntrophorhabdaceae bacterium]